MSVFTIDLATNKVVDKYKTGHQIGHMVEDAEVVGGASPNSIAVGTQYAYVTNATNDNISVKDFRNHKIVNHIPIQVDPRLDKLRGLLPFGITLSSDEQTLYVALLVQLTARVGWQKAVVALANKNARILWAVLAKGKPFDPNHVSVKPQGPATIGTTLAA